MMKAFATAGALAAVGLLISSTHQSMASGTYPPAAIDNLQRICRQAPGISPNAVLAYCTCYVDLMQSKIPWRDYLLLDSAINVKGIAGIDVEEKAILGQVLEVGFYCSQKAAR